MATVAATMEVFAAARRVSVPLVAIRTVDQQATQAAIVARAAKLKHPVVVWDAAEGLRGYTDGTAAQTEGQKAVRASQIKLDETLGFTGAMIEAKKLPPMTIVVAHNAHRQLLSSEPLSVAGAVQAVSNLRDEFKKNFRMLVLLGPAFVLPPEITQDVVTFDHDLPSAAELGETIGAIHKAAKIAEPDAPMLAKAVEAVSGLSLFSAEQEAALSLKESGLDIAALWERKRVAIEQTRGLRVHRGAERFADIVGQDSVKARLRSRLNAKTPVGVVVVLDEIDKVFANVEHDTSGVKLDQVTTFLTEMENNEWRGMVGVGVAGGGKTLLAKAFGNEAGVPTIMLDFGGMEAPHVGESEMLLRQAVQLIKRIGGGRAYFMATSNGASVMRPEMQRRFTDGFFFYDLMTQEERAACWTFYMKRYGLKPQPLPLDAGWTGAEIRNCCRDAWDTGMSLVDAATFIVPMATSRADAIEELRKYANGRFLDANKAGTYRYDPKPMAAQLRGISLADVAAVASLDKES